MKISLNFEIVMQNIDKIIVTGLLIGLTGCAHFKTYPAPAEEARGIWLSRFEYCRSSPDHNQDTIKAYISNIIENAARSNFNIIFFQVRGNGDAYYTPGLEPWGHLLTGEFGQDPGWDPLEYAIFEAHLRGLELHAWINTFPAWRGPGEPPVTEPLSPYLAHPDWVVCDSSGIPMPITDHYVSFSPGNTAVHDYLIKITLDIVNRYDIDGIHFDYIRYPEQSPELGYSHDSVSVALFNSKSGNPDKLDWADWQREQLTAFVVKTYNSITVTKPWVKMSAAVIGTYIDQGWTAYHSVYQDPRRWAELGKIDFVAPMMYHPRSHPTASFSKRALDWKNYYTMDRYVFPGIGSYRYNTQKSPYTWREAEGQINFLRQQGIPGMVFFSAGSLTEHWESIATKYYTDQAEVPQMPWKSDPVLFAPQNISAQIENGILNIAWEDSLNTALINEYKITFYTIADSAEKTIFVPDNISNSWSGPVSAFPGYAMLSISTIGYRGHESPQSEIIAIIKPF